MKEKEREQKELKKNPKNVSPEPFDLDESVGDSALSQESHQENETEPIDRDESTGNRAMKKK